MRYGFRALFTSNYGLTLFVAVCIASQEQWNLKTNASYEARQNTLRLVTGAADRTPRTRAFVDSGLTNVGTCEAATALNKLAQGDPYSEVVEGRVYYPVREAR